MATAVADKMLASCAHLESDLSPKRSDPEAQERGPQLADIQVATWDIWSGKVDDAFKVDRLLEQRIAAKSSPLQSHGSNVSMILVEDVDQASVTSEEERNRRRKQRFQSLTINFLFHVINKFVYVFIHRFSLNVFLF